MVKQHGKLFFAAIALAVLIFDSKTAATGAAEGIALCLTAVIPSLFPFIFLSSVLINALGENDGKFARQIERAFRMPPGSSRYFLTGILGGYPTGAACIAEGHRLGRLDRQQAEFLLCFCNNGGPAFLFGIAGSFCSVGQAFLLWGIHILSALLTCVFLPKPTAGNAIQSGMRNNPTLSAVLVRSVKSMGTVCGWIVLFRILISFCDRWFLWLFPTFVKVIFYGILELTNGCCSLGAVPSPAVRFLLFSAFLSFGGFCVAMQTQAVVAPLSIRRYRIGKCIQCLISLVLCGILIPFLFPGEAMAKYIIYIAGISAALLMGILLCCSKKQ